MGLGLWIAGLGLWLFGYRAVSCEVRVRKMGLSYGSLEREFANSVQESSASAEGGCSGMSE